MSQAFSPPAPLSSGTPPSFAAWIVSGVCLLATAFAWHDVKRSQQLNVRAHFERQTAHVVARIEQALSSCEQALRSAAAVIDSQSIPRARWRDYVTALASAPPVRGIQALGFAPAEEPTASAITETARRPPPFARVTAIRPGSGMAGTPRELAPDRLPAAARHLPHPSPVDNMQPVKGDDGPPVAIMYLPAGLHAAHLESSRGRGRPGGYVYARVDIRDLIESALQKTDSRLRIRVFEGHDTAPESLLYDSNRMALVTRAGADNLMLSKAVDINFGGNRWTILFDAPQESLLPSHSGRAGTYLLAAGLILTVALFVAMRTAARHRKHVLPEHERSHQELKNLVDALETHRDQEQKRLAREMHDDLGQLLAAMKMDLAGLARHVPQTDSAALHRLAGINQLVSAMMTSVRRIISDLPPKALEDLGLFGALRLMAKNFEKRHNVRCRVCLPEYEPRMPQKAASAIYRTVQESLTNVAKHACATDVEITMEILDNRVLLSVADNGKGFSAQALQKAGSFGLIGMRERAGALNGGLKVESAIGSGTTIYVTLPLGDARPCGTESDTSAVSPESA